MQAKFDFASAPKIWVQTGHEKSADFVYTLLKPRIRRFMVAMTGGCGYMSEEEGKRLGILTEAMHGYTGFTVNAATETRFLDDPETVRPTINDVFPNARANCPESVMLGIAVKQKTMRMTPWGVSIGDGSETKTFTVIPTSTKLDAILLYQLGVDDSDPSPWEREWKERTQLVSTLIGQEWGAALIVYNGGKITEKEVRCWAEHGRENASAWPVVLLRGSGRIADTLANDTQFLADHPSVHVADLEVHSMRTVFEKIGVLM